MRPKTLEDRDRVTKDIWEKDETSPKFLRKSKKYGRDYIMRDKQRKIPFSEIKTGDKLIIRYPKTMKMVQLDRLAKMARDFMDKPQENILIVPEGFAFYLLKKGSILEVEIKE